MCFKLKNSFPDEEESVFLHRGTVPVGAPPGYITITHNGAVVFSVRALKLYHAVCSRYGLSSLLRSVLTKQDLMNLQDTISQKCLAAAELAYQRSLASPTPGPSLTLVKS